MSDYGARCACGSELIAPEQSEFVAEREIRHLWSCADCGCSFSMSVRVDGRPLTQTELFECFLPSLLVA